MPRSPLIASATRELAQYFQAITDASFIDRSWAIKGERESSRGAAAVANSQTAATGSIASQTLNPLGAIGLNDNITRTGLINMPGTEEADHISNLVNGATSIGEYLVANSQAIPAEYQDQFKLYYRAVDDTDHLKMVLFNDFATAASGHISPKPSVETPNVYAVNVYNPFLGPTTRDTGPIEIFMNAIPTLEFSRCVPYLNLDVITTRKEVGDSAVTPSLSMIGFLNPSSRGSADNAMLGAQATQVASEASKLGPGIKSGIELFVMPQTLVNLGDTASEFTPVIDRLRPLASIDNFTLSTKLQGGTLAFTTGRIEITVFDRSRLREVAAFVRPDLYGTTFLDITHGWSHPDGGLTSSNSFGKFLNALKTETRYRVSNSSYSFEEGGKIKITLSVQSMGSIDLLYLGPSKTSVQQKELNQVIRALNAAVAEAKGGGLTTDVKQFDFLDTIKDPSKVLSVAADANELKKLKEVLNSNKLTDAKIKEAIITLFGNISAKATESTADSATGKLRNAVKEVYSDIISKLPTLSKDTKEDANGGADGITTDDPFAIEFISDSLNRFNALNDNKVKGVNGENFEFNNKTGSKSQGRLDQLDYVSYGSAFMKMVVDPLVASNQYDEIQTVFYPFNSFAGAVHDLPISCFPIEQKRLTTAVTELSKKVPDISSQQMIALLQDKFTGYKASRAYLMTGFYNTDKTDASQEVEAVDRYTQNGKLIDVTKTFEQRLINVGIPEAKFVMPKVEVAVEASKLLDRDGFPITDDKGNTKTLLKIHVYDSSMDPHQTLTDIISASNDSGLNIIAVPVANYNAAVNGDKSTKAQNDARNKYGVNKVIEAGIKSGLLEAIDIKTGLPVTGETAAIIEEATRLGTGVYLRIKNDYAKVKELVSAGMPTLTYGSSMSAITTAALATGGNAALSNVLLQRAFAAPGETAPDNVDSGVPMQITPASLSLSTFGCPLFYPMQRFFVDFGTGTSIDSAYFVVSSESSIGSSGYKTDLKLSYSAGFATYVSLNQNLAMLAANFSSATGESSAASTVTTLTTALTASNQSSREAETKIIKAEQQVTRAATEVELKAAEFASEQTARITAEKNRIEIAAKAKAKALEDKIKKQAEKALKISESTKIKAQEAQKKADQAKIKVDEVASQAQKAQEIVAIGTALLGLQSTVTPAYFDAELKNAKAEKDAADAASKEATEAASKEAEKAR